MELSPKTDGQPAELASADNPVYLDYQATTPTDPRVLEAMLPFFSERFGNPHSVSHAYGWRAEEAVDRARAQIAQLIGADPREVIFTSGATESNNLAIKGIARFYGNGRNHIITCVTEHKCVLETCADLEREGYDVTRLPVDADGILDPTEVERAITDRTLAVSVMAANNEIGVLQPIAEIGRICRERDVFFHTDAAQAVGKVPVDVGCMNIDLLSISGHKIYAPMGVGALFVRRRPRVRISPLLSGGGQERGMRSGTLPTPLCVGLGRACEIAAEELDAESVRLTDLRDRFRDGILSRLPGVRVNGHAERRLPGNLNLSFADVEGEGLMAGVPELALSSGSACTSASLEPSYVLRAIGVPEDMAHNSIRFGFGRFTTVDEVDHAVGRIVAAVEKQRQSG
ncbi:MAG: IscS subfamily cysteine desulfurase [Rhodospirillales bacterium]|nr:IscS subfamily cysteine desulfurase [Rhodospirillales bacterium]